MFQTTDLEGRKTFDFLDKFCDKVRFLSETVSAVLNILIKHQKVYYRAVGRPEKLWVAAHHNRLTIKSLFLLSNLEGNKYTGSLAPLDFIGAFSLVRGCGCTCRGQILERSLPGKNVMKEQNFRQPNEYEHGSQIYYII